MTAFLLGLFFCLLVVSPLSILWLRRQEQQRALLSAQSPTRLDLEGSAPGAHLLPKRLAAAARGFAREAPGHGTMHLCHVGAHHVLALFVDEEERPLAIATQTCQPLDDEDAAVLLRRHDADLGLLDALAAPLDLERARDVNLTDLFVEIQRRRAPRSRRREKRKPRWSISAHPDHLGALISGHPVRVRALHLINDEALRECVVRVAPWSDEEGDDAVWSATTALAVFHKDARLDDAHRLLTRALDDAAWPDNTAATARQLERVLGMKKARPSRDTALAVLLTRHELDDEELRDLEIDLSPAPNDLEALLLRTAHGPDAEGVELYLRRLEELDTRLHPDAALDVHRAWYPLLDGQEERRHTIGSLSAWATLIDEDDTLRDAGDRARRLYRLTRSAMIEQPDMQELATHLAVLCRDRFDQQGAAPRLLDTLRRRFETLAEHPDTQRPVFGEDADALHEALFDDWRGDDPTTHITQLALAIAVAADAQVNRANLSAEEVRAWHRLATRALIAVAELGTPRDLQLLQQHNASLTSAQNAAIPITSTIDALLDRLHGGGAHLGGSLELHDADETLAGALTAHDAAPGGALSVSEDTARAGD